MSRVCRQLLAWTLGIALSSATVVDPYYRNDDFYTSPAGLAERYLQNEDWAKLDTLVDEARRFGRASGGWPFLALSSSANRKGMARWPAREL